MHLKKIYLSIFLITALFSDARIKYLQKDADIEFIGKRKGYERITVPKEIVEYEPILRDIENTIFYTEREIKKATCIIDQHNHEACPLDKEECGVKTEYTQGSASIGEGHISCSQLDNTSYFSDSLNKCVLPASSANVCKNYKDSHYDSARDKCVAGEQYQASPVGSTVERKWWNCDSCGIMPINQFLPVIQAAGGTYIKISGNYTAGNIDFKKVVHDAKKPFTIWVDGGTVLTVQPGEYFGLAYKRLANKGGTVSSPSVRKPFLYARVATTTYPCKTGYKQIDINGDKWCTNEVLYVPSCENKYFNQRKKDECIGDRKKYSFFNYSCPADLNVYGNPWEIIDPGGDCGEYNLQVDTDGDGLKDECNNPSPPSRNCERTVYNCSFNPDAICILDEKELDYNDFTKWTVENYNNDASAGDWEVLNKNSVLQHKNGYPTYFLSNYELRDGHITMEGTFKTDDPGDNDWFGFVFGLKDTKNYYLLDWSRWKNDNYRSNHDAQGNPTLGAIPLTLSKVSNLGTYGPLWNHLNNGNNFKVLQRKDNGGWTSGQEYKIKIDVTRNDIKVWIGKVGEPMSLDINYHSNIAMDITGKLGFYNFSISKVTYKDFKIEWANGQDIDHTKKRLLGVPSVEGEYKSSEFGTIRGYECGENCRFALSKIYVKNQNSLCFKDRVGSEGCFNFSNECEFTGLIQEIGNIPPPLYSFLNSPNEDIPNYNGNINEEHDSPTGISLDFNDLDGSTYFMQSVKDTAMENDKVTVDFWMKWDGYSEGMIFGFQEYGLWMSRTETDKYVFGFNNQDGNILGINDASILKSGWHRVTAVFTHGDVEPNKIYIDGNEQVIQNNVITGKATVNGSRTLETESYDTHFWRWGIEDLFRVDTNKVYQMNGSVTIDASMLSSGQILPPQYLGYASYDIDKKLIGAHLIMKAPGSTDTRLSRDLKPGDTKMYLDDATGWVNSVGHVYDGIELNHSFLWYGYVDSTGHVYDDYSYTRNHSGFGVWKEGAIKNVSGQWEISLYKPWSGPLIHSGTAVRNGDRGGTYNYAVFNGERLDSGVHSGSITFGGEILNDGINYLDKFRPGTAYVCPVTISNYRTPNPVKVKWHDISMSHSDSGLSPSVNLSPDIRRVMQLSGFGKDGGNSFGGKIAGINVYDGELSSAQIERLINGEYFNGVSYLKIDQNTITGYDAADTELGNIVSTCKLSGKVGFRTKEGNKTNPITAAIGIDNRIEFWDSFTAGSVGHIEPLKYVKEDDKKLGYEHEFKEFSKLYQSGFTAFKSFDNNNTYAVSLNPMSITECAERLKNTHYFLAERNSSDQIGIDAVRSLNHYSDGSFGEYCIIEKTGSYDNYHAQYAVKDIHLEKVYPTYYCSPWSCESHQCGVASCKKNFLGNVIKNKDRSRVLNSVMCIDQECDINDDYFSVCGNKTGCPDTPGIYKKEDDQCVQAECKDGGSLNTQSGMCEKLGCKNSIDAGDGTCFKKL